MWRCTQDMLKWTRIWIRSAEDSLESRFRFRPSSSTPTVSKTTASRRSTPSTSSDAISTVSGSMIITTLASVYHSDSIEFPPQDKKDSRHIGKYCEKFQFARKIINSILDLRQVIAFICGLIVIILMIMSLASTDWLMAAGWRQGLFVHCIEDNAVTPLPFDTNESAGCYQSRDVAYIKAAAALCVITLLTDLVATVLTGLGLRSKEHHTKYKYYRFAVLVMVLSLISILIALVIYPVCFAAELNTSNRAIWEFGWAYGVGWGAAIFLFGGVILLLCDKESEEIYYKERKIVQDNDSRA